MKDFILGFSTAMSAVSHLHRPHIKRFIIIPLLINILLFAVGLYCAFFYFDDAIAYIELLFPTSVDTSYSVLNTMYGYMMSVIGWLLGLLWFVFVMSYLAIVFYTFTIVANIISSPFNGYFSSAVEKNILGIDHTQEIAEHANRTVMQELIVTIGNEAQKLVFTLSRLALLIVATMVLFFVPVLNMAIPFLWFFYGARMMSVMYVEVPLSNYGLTFADEKRIINEHSGLTLGFGSAIMLMTMVPVLNFFALPVGVAGATVLFDKYLRQHTNVKSE